MASSARSFLRFLLLQGLISRNLAAAVPSFANWRLASLPLTVDTADLERVVAAADPSMPIGMRDRAVVLCMTELGLRASEVARLCKDAVDFDAGIMRLERPKQRDMAEFPLCRRLANAISLYLSRGRPDCSTGALFVIHRAPIGSPLKPIGIHTIVTRLAARAGLDEQIRGTHVIRHSLATSLINRGASIKHIADLLGHRSIDTAAIYAKVDLRALTGVALPWPVGGKVAK